MKETLKRIKADVILSALLCVALGVVLIIWSDETISAICMLLAPGPPAPGPAHLVGPFTNTTKQKRQLVQAVCCLHLA